LLYQQASFTDAQIDDYTNDFLEGYIEDILKGTVLYENILLIYEESTYIFQPLLKQFNDKLNELEDRGPSYGYNIFTSYQ